MREVASFMEMYPSYTLRAALQMYAVSFFSLLNQGYRHRYEKYAMLATLASVPHMEESERNRFMHNLEWAAKDPRDMLKADDGAIDIEGLKNVLG